MIFALLVRKNELVHAHNEINFPQGKLDQEKDVPFLLCERCDLYILLHNNSVHIVFFNFKKIYIIFYRKKKRYR